MSPKLATERTNRASRDGVESNAKAAIELLLSIMDDPDLDLAHEDRQHFFQFIGLLTEIRDGEYTHPTDY